MVHGAIDGARRPHSRDRLLSAAIAYVAAHGLHDRSLRELAAAIGTSHRMLIYHFGSKEGLMRAIVEEVENQQREFFARFVADLTVPPREAALAFWQRLTDPSLANNERLFFELYGQALQGRPGTQGFLDRIVDAWVEPLTDYGVSRGLPLDTARADARLGVAVTRGLLLDLVATGDRAAVDEAYRRYLQMYDATSGRTMQRTRLRSLPESRHVLKADGGVY
jgi:AcrR family transcriptional regulator